MANIPASQDRVSIPVGTTSPTLATPHEKHAPQPFMPAQKGVPSQDYSTRSDPRERRQPTVTGIEWEEEEGWAEKTYLWYEKLKENAIIHPVPSSERRKGELLTQDQVQERIKCCPKISKDYI